MLGSMAARCRLNMLLDRRHHRSERRTALKALPQLEIAVVAGKQRWTQVGAPAAEELQAQIGDTDRGHMG